MSPKSLKPVAKRAGDVPETYLRRALDAASPEERIEHAREGLALRSDDFEVETRMLLMRQLYRAHLDLRQLKSARDVALGMAELGPLKDIAHHDAARVLFALGEVAEAVKQQRLSCLAAPSERRAFQFWCLSTLQFFADQPEDSLRSIKIAEESSIDDRELMAGQRAYVSLASGQPVENLSTIKEDLARARRTMGYADYLLGMIAEIEGDAEAAREHLERFVERNKNADTAKALTLREEMRRARVALAKLL